MPIIIATSHRDAARAGAVARAVELRRIQLVDGTFRFWSERLRMVRNRAKPSQAPIELDVSPNVTVNHIDDRVLAFITIGLVGFITWRKQRTRVIQSRCKFTSEYLLTMERKPTRSELRAFARTNALFNVWPYWREFVQSMASRAGLPPLVVPLLQIRPALPAHRPLREGPRPK